MNLNRELKFEVHQKSESFMNTIVLENDRSLELLQNEAIFNSSLKVACSVLRSLNPCTPNWGNFSMPPLFRSSEDYNEFFYLCFTTSKSGVECEQLHNIIYNLFNWKSHSFTFVGHNYWIQPFFTDFCKIVSENYNKHGFESVALPYYMLVNSVVQYMALKSKYVINCIDIDVIKTAPVDEIIKYYTYQIDREGLSFDEVVAFLVCFIQYYKLVPSKSLQEIIDYCNALAKRYVEQIKISKVDNTVLLPSNIDLSLQKIKEDIEEKTARAIAKAEEDAARAKAKEEDEIEKAKKIKEKIHNYKISQNIQKLINDPSMENAVSNLIAMFPNKFIFDFLCYHYTRQFFYDGIGNTDDFQYIRTPQYQGADRQSYSLLMEFSIILSKRFHISEDELRETTWGVFNYFFIKRYSQKWLDICCTGKVGERDYETYLLDCFNDDMISIHDAESVALFTYYYCTVNNGDSTDSIYLNQPTAEQYNSTVDLLKKYEAKRKSDNFEAKLFGNKFSEKKKTFYTIDDVDEMTGTEFEVLISNLFHSMKFTTQLTKASGDQGIDVIAEKNGIKYGIQAKCYSGSVGNSAIQEAVAGKQFYGLDKVFVVTNNKFTKSAIKLAQSNDVVLWDRNILSEKLMLLK